MAELAAKYRDRARERRDGGAPGAPVEGATADEAADEGESAGGAGASNTSGYRAVAPDVKSSYDAAERRKRMIQVRFLFLHAPPLHYIEYPSTCRISHN